MPQFEVGIGVRDITPPPGARLWGYGDRTGPATGTLDPLYVRSVIYRTGGQLAAHVVLDLGRVPTDTSLKRIRLHAQSLGIQRVMFSATHTHHAPIMEMMDAPYISLIEDGIRAALSDSVTSFQPVRMGVGTAEFDIAHNRRFITPDGRCLMRWRNDQRRPTAPIDKQATLVRFDGLDGTPLLILVHYACHPVVMGPSNLEYSADYIGELTKSVREESGAECVFIQGGCGDINPFLDKTPVDEGGVELMRQTGRDCAKRVLDSIPAIVTAEPEAPSVQYSEREVHVGVRWDFSDPACRAAFEEAHGWLSGLTDAYWPHIRDDLAVPVSVLTLNRSLSFVGVPGEFFVEDQLELKRGSPISTTLLCGYTNQFHLYIPPIRQALAGGYGGTGASYVGIGAAERLILASKHLLAEHSGKLRRICTKEDFAIVDDDWNSVVAPTMNQGDLP